MTDIFGKCRLCLCDDAALRESHVIPRWAYARLRDERKGEPSEPIRIEDGEARRTAKQVKEYMLCDSCEQRFGDYDNELSRLACKGTEFLALTKVGKTLGRIEDMELVESGSLDAGRLFYFACSVVWRGHEARTLPNCSLGPLAEQFRTFLDGKSESPPRVYATLSLLTNGGVSPLSRIISMPLSARKRPLYSHEFVLSGMYFAVHTGSTGSSAIGLTSNPPAVTLVSSSRYGSWLPDIGGTPFIGRNPPKPSR